MCKTLSPASGTGRGPINVSSGVVVTAGPFPAVPLSVVSVAHGRPWSEDIKWKSPETNNS